MREVIWLVGIVVVVMFVVAVMVLNRGWADAEGLKIANEVVRTAAAVGVFVLALIAYHKWRRPEDARRRGDAAQEILRLSGRLKGRILAARPLSFTVIVEGKVEGVEEKVDLLKSQEIPRAELRRLEETYREFQTYHAEAGHLFRGSQAAELMAELDGRAEEIRKSWKIIAGIKSGAVDHLLENPRVGTLVDEAMQTANVLLVDAESGDERDVFEEGLRETGRKLQAELGRFLVGY